MQTRDLPLLKSLKTATVAPAPLAIRCTSDKTVLGKVHSMELGIYHEFPVLPGRSQAECFAAGFDIVDASEEYGLDVMWLAELHFDKRRALAASPLVLGTAIAARTERIRIGTSVQVLPLANPLRIAEESAMRSGLASGSTCTLVPILILSVRAAIAVPRIRGLAARARRLSKCSSASHITSRPYSSLASTMSNPAAKHSAWLRPGSTGNS